MLSEFRSQVFQLPLISTSWIHIHNRYVVEKENSLFPIRLTLSIIEKTVSNSYERVLQPLLAPYHTYLNSLDHFLCSYVNSVRHLCPIVDQTSDEVIERYGESFFLSFVKKTSKPSAIDSCSNDVRRERKGYAIERYLHFLTNILMIIEMYSKYVQNELNDHVDTSRNLWKNLNMEDGRSIDQVESFSEKLLVLGRRMTGNYRQFVYLIRYQLKRIRCILLSVIHAQNRFRTTVWRITRKTQINRMNQKFNDRTRHGVVSSAERVRHYLEIMMLHAAKHPWMRWTTAGMKQPTEPSFPRPLKSIRPIFFVSSNNTSDCSGSEDNHRERCSKMFESTPLHKRHNHYHVTQAKAKIEDILSDISSSSSNTPVEQSFDVKEIVRQVNEQADRTSETNSSIDRDDENRLIEQALYESDDNEQQQQQPPVSVFDLSPMLASGCAV